MGRNLPFPITLAVGLYNSLYCRPSRDTAITTEKVNYVAVFQQSAAIIGAFTSFGLVPKSNIAICHKATIGRPFVHPQLLCIENLYFHHENMVVVKNK